MFSQFQDISPRLCGLFPREWIQGAKLSTGKKDDVESAKKDFASVLSAGRGTRVRKNMELLLELLMN